jgi:hypothetical protein
MQILSHIGAQGELRIYKIDSFPEGIGTKSPERAESGAFIISHSEKGHHHVIGGDVDVIEHEETVQFNSESIALRTLYAIVREPTALHQTATDNHDDIMLDPGKYMIRADVEFNPFGGQIRQVTD